MKNPSQAFFNTPSKNDKTYGRALHCLLDQLSNTTDKQNKQMITDKIRALLSINIDTINHQNNDGSKEPTPR